MRCSSLSYLIIIHAHDNGPYNRKHGLSKTAKTLAEEAKLPPLTEFSEGRERGGRNTLDKMIIQYCVDQHKRCPAPIASLPPFNLLQPHRYALGPWTKACRSQEAEREKGLTGNRAPHRCPTPLNVPFPRGLKAPLNIASRLAAREFSVTPRHGGLKGTFPPVARECRGQSVCYTLTQRSWHSIGDLDATGQEGT